MTRQIKVLNAQSGDWKGLYIDGRLVFEGHEIPLGEVIHELCPEDSYDSVWDSLDPNLDRFGGQCPPEWPEEEL